MSSNVPAGSTQVPVGDAAGCDAGDCLTIGTGSSQETVCILSVSGNTITLTAPTKNTHSAGEVVAAALATPTPAGLPNTGGSTGTPSAGPWLMLLAFAGLIAGATAYQRARSRRTGQ